MSLPHLTVSWCIGDEDNEITVADGIFPEGRGVVIGVSGYRPRPVVSQNEKKAVAVIGAPVMEEKVCPKRVSQDLLVTADVEPYARQLNGQYLNLILEKKTGTLTVFNDRFNGVPFYWANINGRFLGSYLYFDLFKIVRHEPGVSIRQDTMMQFLWLNRLMMDDTYDSVSKFMMPASLMSIRSDGLHTKKYWRPRFDKNLTRGVRDSGDEYVHHLRRSVTRLTSDDDSKCYGHFLSGGHDSRSILAAFSTPPVSLTVSFSDNLEVSCAREAALAVSSPHKFIPLENDHMVRHFDESVVLCGGMYSFLDALFIGLEEQVQSVANVVLHGHGLDYLFQGMYLPSRWVYFLGRPTFFKKLRSFEQNVVDTFLFEIPFRTKGVDIYSLIREDKKECFMSELRSSISSVLDDGADICQDKYDQWEYLIIHALGRHYSRPNVDSKLSCAEQRTPCFDNDLFDFYLSLPPKHRVQGEMMRHALNTMNSKLGRITTGNWGLPAGASPFEKTTRLIGRKVLRDLTGNKAYSAPSLSDRTWPDRELYLSQHPILQAHVRAALSSEELEQTLTHIDWGVLRDKADKWLSGTQGGAAFLMALVTLHRFLLLSR